MIDFSVRENKETGLVEIINNSNEFDFQKIVVLIDNQKVVVDDFTNPVLFDFLSNNAQIWIDLKKADAYEAVVCYLTAIGSEYLSVNDNLLSVPNIYNQTLDADELYINDRFYKIEKAKSSANCLFLDGLIGDCDECIYKVRKVKHDFCYLFPVKRTITKSILNNCFNNDLTVLFTLIDIIEDKYLVTTFEEKKKLVRQMLTLI